MDNVFSVPRINKPGSKSLILQFSILFNTIDQMVANMSKKMEYDAELVVQLSQQMLQHHSLNQGKPAGQLIHAGGQDLKPGGI